MLRSWRVPSVQQNISIGQRFNIQDKVEFLREDLTHLFDDQGINASEYDSVVDFRDPITKYSTLGGYLFNIAMLKNVFSPIFELHDIKATGDYEVTSRWTMTLSFILAQKTPVGKWWDPKLVFTGTSIYVYNPENLKIFRHIDTWDSVDNQEFFSVEAFGDFFRQLLTFYTTPRGLETPKYTILRRARDYEVRRYEPYIVAESPLDGVSVTSAEVPGGFSPAGLGRTAFQSLAGYIFGGNAAGTKMAMTTPVLSDTRGFMQFVIGPSAAQSPEQLPPASSAAVCTRMMPGGEVAALKFSGVVTPKEAATKHLQLRAAVERDGLQPAGQDWQLARYNDPSTPAPLRRNEILLPLKDYRLW